MFITEIVLVIALFWLFKLSSHVDEIDRTLNSLQNSSGNFPQKSQKDLPEAEAKQPLEDTVPSPTQKDKGFSVTAWLSHEWPLKLGSLFVLIGIGWFVSYAFTQYGIGPQGKVLTGFIVGSGILIWGYIHSKKNLHQSAIIVGLGGAIILLSLYAATTVYSFFSPEVAFGLFGIVLVYISFLAYKNRYQPMALVALIMAAVIPYIVGGRSLSLATFYIYMLAVVGGSLWLVAVTRWRVLTFVANVIVFLHSIPFLRDYLFQKPTSIIEPLTFAFTFAGIFFTARLVDQYLSKKTSQEDIAGSVINTGFMLAWIYAAVPVHLQSVIAGLASALTLSAAWIIYFSSRQKPALVLYASMTWIFVFAAAAFELEESTLPMVMSVMITIYTILLSRVLTNHKTAVKSGLLYIFPVIFSLSDMFYFDSMYNITDTYVIPTLATLSASFYIFVTYFYSKLHQTPDYPDVRGYIITAGYAATIYLYILIGRFSEEFFTGITQLIAPIIMIAIIGTALYVYGNVKAHKSIRLLGFMSMIYVSLRILFIESYAMPVSAKIITFIGIGAIFMSTMFTHKLKKV